MNLKDMAGLLKIASSGEVQGFVAKFETELAAITADRLALKQAFPAGFKHFNQRFDTLEVQVKEIHGMLSEIVGSRQLIIARTMEQDNVGHAAVTIDEHPDAGQHVVNGTSHPEPVTTGPET